MTERQSSVPHDRAPRIAAGRGPGFEFFHTLCAREVVCALTLRSFLRGLEALRGRGEGHALLAGELGHARPPDFTRPMFWRVPYQADGERHERRDRASRADSIEFEPRPSKLSPDRE